MINADSEGIIIQTVDCMQKRREWLAQLSYKTKKNKQLKVLERKVLQTTISGITRSYKIESMGCTNKNKKASSGNKALQS